MDKLKMHSLDLTQDNIARIRELFPGCVTEAQGDDGQLRLAVDFDQLRQELSEFIVEGPQERYHLNWPGKREALLTANAPIVKTLRPCREESVDFDTTKNLFIEGDNLEALKLLQETYLGKIKMIYIDPPYNTGNDFIYEDDYSENTDEFLSRSNQKDAEGNRLVANTEANGRFHSDWISMIFSRLKLARNLLKEDGLIFISIDDGEVANLRKCCDEIFGENNFIAQIAWEKRYTRSNNAKRFYSLKDTILVFRKSELLAVIKEPRTDKADSSYRNPDNDPKGPWTTSSYVNPATKEARPNLVYGIANPFTGEMVNHPTHAWKFGLTEHKAHVEDKRLWWGNDGGAEFPRLKIYLSEQTEGMVPIDVWDYKSSGTTDEGGAEIKELFGAAVFDTPKPTKLLRRMLGIATEVSENDIVLDFFAGSSSSAAAVILQNAEDGGNRRTISVQIGEPCAKGSIADKEGFTSISEISKERIRRAGKKILEGKCHEKWNKDIGFRVLKVDSSNMTDVYYTPDAIDQAQVDAFVDNIKPDRKPEDLLFQVLLDWGVDLSLPIRKETIQGKTVFFVNEPPYDLVACFDTGVNEDLVKELARFEPLRVVFRDTGFVSDAVKINVEQIFKQMSPGTEVKAI
ncbi:site-specific DNA-methyltransferase [Alloalcanivorax xenomutans]|jgi:adenine-specific DNA-methyltransferase|uniref:site-specific DNA-methyltransferase (adenine-specific) n=1 Tax=Alloalcanivorax xenomutans TaxID=1094342 RepID=A0A9Q3W6L5_9GAMM|nr:site-specific DNA-methyltransferase [Alloalcanivorax xenomutans]MBA4721447.1 site-specific DNA-methyltransferase [Alcanivorax sp.]MCE7509721.1 site-specific DNA-methyltransferase [Alloalcanivorax xenomutans]CUR45085.1 Type III restriction-modification system methylation subunit [Alloalcanivorax xenomutans]